ncbi:unnamed protein product [Durusdinium trenchii]|uniref:Casein kinase I n=1 Tax=Durusdinium trenchii TaxID=1381693 RepID=A0ABP0SCW6_9DINO
MDPSDGVDGGRGSAPSATPEEHPGAEQYTFSDDEEEEDDVISDVEDAAGAARRSIRERLSVMPGEPGAVKTVGAETESSQPLPSSNPPCFFGKPSALHVEATAALRSCRRALGRPKLARAMGSVRPELDFDDVLPDESSEAGSTLRGSNVHFHVSGSECTTRSGLYAKQTSSTTELPTPLKDTKLEALEASDGRPPVPKSVGRFQILRKLGSGSYSVVHLAFDKEENQLVAVKFEWQNAEKTDKLLKEAALLEVFGSRSPRTTSMIWTGTKGEYDIMAMNLLGPSLEDVFMKKCRRKFSLKTVLMIGEQMIDCMEFVHSHKILHRDIKPSNFVLGPKGQQEKIYVVDFGLAKSFRDGRGRHIPCVKKSGMTGTARYTTVNLHRGYEPSRRDDLGSIGYVLLYFLRGQLPWQGINHRDKKKRKKRIGKKKTATMHLPQRRVSQRVRGVLPLL